jgi:hypothetical protein
MILMALTGEKTQEQKLAIIKDLLSDVLVFVSVMC